MLGCKRKLGIKTITEKFMDKKLKNKVAVVTGGSAGIGLGAAKRFAVEGAQVFITGRGQLELDKAAAAIGGNVHTVRGDTSKLADIDRIYDNVKEKAGRIDILFVNAGFYELGEFGEMAEERFDKTFNTNVRGLFFAVRKALPLLSQGSSVILSLRERGRAVRGRRCRVVLSKDRNARGHEL
jgi:NAD(P)-dependent dehydrogenase (short-subunit alcohol dehydrogenase family)